MIAHTTSENTHTKQKDQYLHDIVQKSLNYWNHVVIGTVELFELLKLLNYWSPWTIDIIELSTLWKHAHSHPHPFLDIDNGRQSTTGLSPFE